MFGQAAAIKLTSLAVNDIFKEKRVSIIIYFNPTTIFFSSFLELFGCVSCGIITKTVVSFS